MSDESPVGEGAGGFRVNALPPGSGQHIFASKKYAVPTHNLDFDDASIWLTREGGHGW